MSARRKGRRVRLRGGRLGRPQRTAFARDKWKKRGPCRAEWEEGER